MPEKVIDIHPHIISPDQKKYPIAPLGGKQSDWSRERPASFEDLVEQMDQSGTEKAVIVHSSTAYGFDNSYVADSIAGHTDRFGGVFSIDIRAADVRSTMDYWLDRPGMIGIRIYTAGTTLEGQAFPVDDPTTYEAWSHASERGVPICLSITPAAVPDIRSLAKRFPDAIIILDSLARPVLDDGPPYTKAAPLLSLVDLPNVYLKVLPRTVELASKGAADPQSFFELVVSRFGSERIAWGSNYPNNEGSLADLIKISDEAFSTLSERDRYNIFAGTALRLYPSLASAPGDGQ